MHTSKNVYFFLPLLNEIFFRLFVIDNLIGPVAIETLRQQTLLLLIVE